MESQLGLITLWTQGDWVTKAVALLLLGMSLASWIVILIKALDIFKFKSLAQRTETFWHSADFSAGMTALGPQQDNPFRNLAEEGREATTHHRNTKAHLHDSLDISDWITRCLRNSMDHGIEDAGWRAKRGKPPNGRLALSAHHPAPDTLGGGRGRFDAAHELVAGHAREGVVALHHLEVGVADARHRHPHERLA